MIEPATVNPGGLVAPRRLPWAALAPIVIVAAALAAYANSLNGPFIFDDVHAIPKNPAIRSLGTFWKLIPPERVGVARRPVSNLTFAINYAISQLNVRSYHVGNLLIHVLAALTLYGIIRRTLRLPSLRDRFGGAATALATAAALIWAVHPLETESVTYIVQRHESLASLFYLLTLYCVIRGATSARPWSWHAPAIAACALGMGAKEIMATAPIVVLLYDRAFLSGSFRELFRRRGRLYLGLAATWLALVAIMLIYKYPQAGVQLGIKRTTSWEHLRTQPGVILHYLALSFWPRPLVLDYSWPVAKTFWRIAPAAVAVAALLGATVWAFFRRPALGFLGVWFFLILAPTSSILPLEECFEHRMYLPLAAVILLALIAAYYAGEWLLRHLPASEPGRKIAGCVAALVLVLAAAALSCATARRNLDYRTAFSMWQDAATKRPNNARALTGLGAAYLELPDGRRDEAMAMWYYNAAIGKNPQFPDAYVNRAGLLYLNGNLDDAIQAIQDYTKAIELRPSLAEAWFGRALAETKVLQIEDAKRDYLKAIEYDPSYAEAYNNLGKLQAEDGRFDDAILSYSGAIKLKPDPAITYLSYINRAEAYSVTKRLVEAIADYGEAIKLKPDSADAHYNRALALAGLKRTADAVKDFDEVIRLKPDNADAFFNRANACVALRRYDLALPDCTRAIELKKDYAVAFNTRAIIYFKLNDFDHAWLDVAAFRKLGGHPNPGFLDALKKASGRSE